MGLNTEVAIVVPCYNEEMRLDTGAYRIFLRANPGIDLVLVNDGSTDATLITLRSLEIEFPRQVAVIDQQPNRGKAEAVRIGLLAACARAPIVGFWDADLATPLSVVCRFAILLTARPEVEWVFGSRVKLLGRQISRHETRHYAGRVFATGASLMLGLGVYDTQCGAKMFRSSPAFQQLLEQPFLTRWIFDVELIARRIAGYRNGEWPAPELTMLEEPLDEWRDIAGSKVKLSDFIRSGAELVRVWWHYLR